MGILRWNNFKLRDQNQLFHWAKQSIISIPFTSPRYSVTAAHCREFSNLRYYKITTGHTQRSYRRARGEPGFQESKLSMFNNHPQYHEIELFNDLAILQMTSPFSFTEYVRPGTSFFLWFFECQRLSETLIQPVLFRKTFNFKKKSSASSPDGATLPDTTKWTFTKTLWIWQLFHISHQINVIVKTGNCFQC